MKQLASESHIKVVQFFMDNPNSVDTPRGVSAWTNLSLNDSRDILEELAKKGILRAYRTSSTVGYSLTENKKVLKMLDRMKVKHKK